MGRTDDMDEKLIGFFSADMQAAIKGEKEEPPRALVVSEKDSFLTRVLINKLSEIQIKSTFSVWEPERIERNWDKKGPIILYMDEGRRPPDDLMPYLSEQLSDSDTYLIPIGTSNELKLIKDSIPPGLIYKTFSRPVDHVTFLETVSDLFKKTTSGGHKRTILIVDDDPGFLGIAREWLRDSYKVAMVTSGLQAIKWLGKNKADLILLDHEMPVTSGPQVLQMLRSEPETSSIPVMFLTGKSDRESVMAVLDLKPEGYFLKSIHKEELLEKLSEFFLQREKT